MLEDHSTTFGTMAQNLIMQCIDLCDKLFFPGIYAIDIAELYINLKGKDSEPLDFTLLAVCLYETTKQAGTPRTLRECAATVEIPEKDLTKTVKKHFPASDSIHPCSLICRFAQRVGLS